MVSFVNAFLLLCENTDLSFNIKLACVAGVERGRGRGNLGARESVWGARGGKERNACKDAIVLSKPPLN